MKNIAIVFLYLVFASALRAEIAFAESLEWLADTATSIGIYEVTESRRKSDWEFDLSLRLHETLKGAPLQAADTGYRVRYRSQKSLPNVSAGDRFLVFLKLNEKADPQVSNLINLTTYQIGGERSTAITSKFELLADERQILAVVNDRLKAHPEATPTPLREYPSSRFDVYIPSGTPADRAFRSGSGCVILVPDDLKPPKPKPEKR